MYIINFCAGAGSRFDVGAVVHSGPHNSLPRAACGQRAKARVSMCFGVVSVFLLLRIWFLPGSLVHGLVVRVVELCTRPRPIFQFLVMSGSMILLWFPWRRETPTPTKRSSCRLADTVHGAVLLSRDCEETGGREGPAGGPCSARGHRRKSFVRKIGRGTCGLLSGRMYGRMVGWVDVVACSSVLPVSRYLACGFVHLSSVFVVVVGCVCWLLFAAVALLLLLSCCCC